jgi:conjugal transfer pilus assembly protein TraK
MDRQHKAWPVLLLPALWLAEPAPALQLIEATDGVTTEAIVSIKEPTRLRVDGASITNVFGNIHSNNCAGATSATVQPGHPTPAAPTAPAVHADGELVIECDPERGEIYLRPVGSAAKPINLFVSTRQATYTLLLRRSDTPADTIVIRDRTPKAAPRDPSREQRAEGHVRRLKAMLVAMAQPQPAPDVVASDVNRPVRLWAEAQMTLTRTYEGRGLFGERYELRNVGNADMVLAEPELDRDDARVLAIAIRNHNLRPGESTAVYVIREGSAP